MAFPKDKLININDIVNSNNDRNHFIEVAKTLRK